MRRNPEVERLLEEDEFRVWIPPTRRRGFTVLAKADSTTPVDPNADRLIHGFCTTEHRDRQDEIVIAKGLDFTPFLKWGWFNDNHSSKTADVLGWPTEARLHEGKGVYVKGFLLKGKKASDDIWELAMALAKSGAPRRLGFSIEGKATRRNQRNEIVEGIVRHVAITNQPVNPNCHLDVLCKAFAPTQEIEARYLQRLSKGLHRKTNRLSLSDVERRVQATFPAASEALVSEIAAWAIKQ